MNRLHGASPREASHTCVARLRYEPGGSQTPVHAALFSGRLGSLADALALEPLSGGLAPIKPITADLDLEPGTDEPTVWRDGRWRVRWPRTVNELLDVIGQ